MAAVLDKPKPVSVSPTFTEDEELFQPRRWTVEEYHRLAEVGILGPDERVELIRGSIIPKVSPQSAWHASHVDIVDEELENAFGEGYFVRQQKPLPTSGDSEPEPDLLVVKGSRRDFISR